MRGQGLHYSNFSSVDFHQQDNIINLLNKTIGVWGYVPPGNFHLRNGF